MRITTKDIVDLILLSKTSSCDSNENRNQIAEINRDLSENTLEIEGYERVPAWIKFDPDNPKTHPGEHARVLFSVDGTITCGTCQFILMAKWRGAEKIHWRPLPEPPQETEGK